MPNKLDFLLAAIADTQATIRALDVKVATLLVGLLAPLSSINRIFSHLEHLATQSPKWAFLVLSISFVAVWVLALYALVRAISAIDNPSEHIINTTHCKGTFYAGGLYTLALLDAFLNRGVIKASKDPKSFASQLPNNATEIESELVFEHMKVAYIRDIKINRLKWGIRFSSIWLILGIGMYLCSKYIV